jgi:hypothetical protein
MSQRSKVKISNLLSPILFGCDTGGLLPSTLKKEYYAVIWEWTQSQKQVIEMPTGGTAITRFGKNILFFEKKEQCLTLLAQLKQFFLVTKYYVLEVCPDGSARYVYPFDNVFDPHLRLNWLESFNRPKHNFVDHAIGQNK